MSSGPAIAQNQGTIPQSLSDARVSTYAAVPQQLKDLPNWVVWKYETRGGKETKVPYDAKSKGEHVHAKSNNNATWTTFGAASKVADDILSKYDGIGFMLNGSKFVGIDFDGVVDDGVPEPYVLNIISQLGNPYCEVTPSGTGLRVFVECAQLPPGGRKFAAKKKGFDKYGAEIYAGNEGGRYLTTTGEHFSGEGIPSIPDLDLVYFLLSKFADEHFRRLWMGDASEYENDASRVDLALLGLLARAFGGDIPKMTRFFDASVPGHREKWIERADYRELTISKAISGMSNKSSPEPEPAAALVRRGDTVKLKRVEWLWQDRIPLSKIALFCGNPDNGKSLAATSVAAICTTGREFPGGAPNNIPPSDVVMLLGEDDIDDTAAPRFEAAGGDLSKVHFLEGIKVGASAEEREVRLDQDIKILESMLGVCPRNPLRSVEFS